MQTNEKKYKQMQTYANKQTVGRDNSTSRRRGHVARNGRGTTRIDTACTIHEEKGDGGIV